MFRWRRQVVTHRFYCPRPKALLSRDIDIAILSVRPSVRPSVRDTLDALYKTA